MNCLRGAFPLYTNVYIDAPEISSSVLLPSPPLGSKANLLKYLPSKLSSRDDTGYVLELLASKKRKPLCLEVGKLRAIKSEHEQKVMRAAANISSKAHTKVSTEEVFICIRHSNSLKRQCALLVLVFLNLRL
jgi:intermediate cleaving peptidase 55